MSKVFRLALFAALMSVPFTAWSGNPARTFTVSPFAGWQVFEGNVGVDDRPVAGLALGYNLSANWGVEALGSFTATALDVSGGPDVKLYAARLDLLRHFRADQRLVPYVAVGAGVLNARLDKEKAGNNDALLGYGAGIKYFLPDDVALRLDLHHLIDLADSDAPRDLYNFATVTAGVTIPLDGRRVASRDTDSDGDGILDALDRCPNTPATARVDASGCPLDSDSDGVADDLDACPATPSGIKVDARGCPLDSDGDGVDDSRDRCEVTPSGTPVDADGCPVAKRFDADGDGVEDGADRCPNTPVGVQVNVFGCPLDSDGDGIFDIDDRCPETPAATPVDAAGCPAAAAAVPAVAAPAVAAREEFRLDILFAEGKAEVAAKYQPQLAKAAAYINANPDARFVVEGHTDAVGNERANLALSQKRAESVRNALVRGYGIAAQRLEARGFGEQQPIADNATPEGRLLNRRVVVTPLP